MSELRDGGTAFPADRYEDNPLYQDLGPNTANVPSKMLASYPGMSLRDYFAAAALVLVSDANTLAAVRDFAKERRVDASEMIATHAYAVADAMLKERAKV